MILADFLNLIPTVLVAIIEPRGMELRHLGRTQPRVCSVAPDTLRVLGSREAEQEPITSPGREAP